MTSCEAEELEQEALETAPERATRSLGVLLSLAALYVIWGSTYLAIRIAVEAFPPFLMAGIRFVVAGGALYAVLRLRGAPSPTARQWLGSFVMGVLLLAVGNGGVSFAETHVASSLAATMVATVPLWAGLFAGLFGRWPTRLEAIGLALGFAGIGVLNLGGSLRAEPVGAVALLLAPAGWAFGSIWSRRLTLPNGMMASAAEMLTGGALLFAVSLLSREGLPAAVSIPSLLAVAYLVVFGSLVAFSAYNYLLQHVRPALATSYAYANPVVAVLLGVGLAGERITIQGLVALPIILTGVALVVLGRVHS